MSHWDFGRPPADQREAASPPAAGAGDPEDLYDEGFELYPITYERDRIEPEPSGPAAAPYGPFEPYEPWPAAPSPAALSPDEEWLPDDAGRPEPDEARRPEDDDAWRPEPDGAWRPEDEWPDDPAWPSPPRASRPRSWPRRHRRWLSVAGIAAVAVAAGIAGTAVLLSGGRPVSAAAAGSTTRPAGPTSAPAGSQTAAPATSAPPVTMTQARTVLAGYTAGNNNANAARSDQRLAVVETGSSYAIDAGLYRMQRAAGTAPYPAYGPARATYYIPRAEPAGGPRWFAVRVANAFAGSPEKVSSVEYLLFVQASPGAPWRDAIEPYLLPDAAAPAIAVGGDGLATAVAATATSLAAAPVRLPGLTAASFDGGGPMTIPANVADLADKQSWQRKMAVLTVTDRHAPATAGQAFALLTTDGGALVFYTVAAGLTLTAPPGSLFRLDIPGLYAPAEPLRRAALQYRDQFAAWDPPAGGGTPRVIADYSGITRRM